MLVDESETLGRIFLANLLPNEHVLWQITWEWNANRIRIRKESINLWTWTVGQSPRHVVCMR